MDWPYCWRGHCIKLREVMKDNSHWKIWVLRRYGEVFLLHFSKSNDGCTCKVESFLNSKESSNLLSTGAWINLRGLFSVLGALVWNPVEGASSGELGSVEQRQKPVQRFCFCCRRVACSGPLGKLLEVFHFMLL